MLVLTSNGLSSQSVKDKLAHSLSGCKEAVIVTTASVGYKENDWNIPRLKEELFSLGLGIDFFDFDTDDPALLLKCDVVELIGGNPFYLLNSMKKSHCGSILKKLVQTKVLIGISAGAIVLQNNINLIAGYSPEMNENINLSDLSGFSLTDIEILPHYSRFLDRFENFEEIASQYEKKENRKVIRLDDGQAVFIKNGHCDII